MDDPALDADEHRRALAGLVRVNALTNASAPPWRAVRSLCESGPGVPADRGHSRPVRILDVATGSGDVLLGLHRRAARAGMSVDLWACDISPVALAAAAERARRAGAPVRMIAADVLAGIPLDDGEVDIACCTLFLHHLSAEHAQRVLAEMARVAAVGVVAVDLQRCGAGLVAAAVVPRLLTRSRVVHVDAVRSVRAAWTEAELLELAGRAGLGGATVHRAWPWRMTLLWRRPVVSG